jgi:hypothetical protein
MKYKDYSSKAKLCEYILSELDRTIDSMASDGMHSDLDMFRFRARKSDLVKKRKEVKQKLDRYVKKNI